jgi:hypothetical protein
VKLDFGIFEKYQSENKAGSVGGISYTSDYYEVPKHLGFAERGDFDVDQKHKVRIIIPKKYYEADGAVHLKFQATFDSGLHDESLGIDNIVFAARRDCFTAPDCVTSSVLSEQTFEDGKADGWSNPKIESSPFFVYQLFGALRYRCRYHFENI